MMVTVTVSGGLRDWIFPAWSQKPHNLPYCTADIGEPCEESSLHPGAMRHVTQLATSKKYTVAIIPRRSSMHM